MTEPIIPSEAFAEDGRKLPMQKCTCGYEFDCASSALQDTERARPGDVTLCLNCGEILIFDQDLFVRLPTIREILDMDKDTWKLARRAQVEIRNRRPLDAKREGKKE